MAGMVVTIWVVFSVDISANRRGFSGGSEVLTMPTYSSMVPQIQVG